MLKAPVQLVILSFLVNLLGCSRSTGRTSSDTRLSELASKSELYRQLIPSVAGVDGFLDTNECDSALLTGLYSAGNNNVNLLLARASAGQWRRRTLSLPDCYYSTPEERAAVGVGDSASSISRDMFIGIYWYLWRHGDLDSLVSLMDYARAHDYRMGDGAPAAVGLMPGLTQTLASMIRSLSNGTKRYDGELLLPQIWPSGLVSYEAHLQIWHILLEAEIHQGVTAVQRDRIREQYARMPRNPLYAAAYARYISGDYSVLLDELLDTAMFPADQLPTRQNYCSSWLLNTDRDDRYAPCTADSPAEEIPTGAELVAVYELVIAPGVAK